MSIENSHPLVQLLAGQFGKEEHQIPAALQSLEETIRLVGMEKISTIDLGNIAHLVDITQLSPAAEPLSGEATDEQVHVFARTNVMWDPLESTCRHASLSIL